MPYIPESFIRQLENEIDVFFKSKGYIPAIVVDTEEHQELLINVIKTARDEIGKTAIILQETANPTSIIGADLYERLRKTHELLCRTVEIEEGSRNEEPK